MRNNWFLNIRRKIKIEQQLWETKLKVGATTRNCKTTNKLLKTAQQTTQKDE
ncbi:MAG: hypothetical protein ROY99_04385 [Ignavibacterium sp.]|jgi:hypothetical protein|nr:hypothetical protein [Ignavibacterium sp.]